MSKRKHEEISSREASSELHSDKVLRSQRQQLEGLLEQGKKSLFRALKVARGFERQKLGRRQKAAKVENTAAEIARLDAEVAALKNLDLALAAELHLYKSLLRIKSVASNPSYPRYVHTTVESAKKPLDTPTANVQARLFNSSPMQTAMNNVLSGIAKTSGTEEAKAPTRKKRLRAKDYASEVPTKEDVEPHPLSNGKGSMPANEEMDSWAGLSSPESRGEAQDMRGYEGEEEDDDIYASRLAASSDEDPISEDSASQKPRPGSLDPDSITEDESESAPEDLDPVPKAKPPKVTSSAAAPKSTTFLPSLSMGGYWSGSESAEDLLDDGAQPRRNRMGQQARRALWEKKFGKNAKHVKTRPQDRDEGWDARKGASASDDRGKRGRGRGGSRGDGGRSRGGGGARGPTSSGANSDPIAIRTAKTKPAADAPLHPSWEAAKKAKEQKKTIAFQGKKVVFD